MSYRTICGFFPNDGKFMNFKKYIDALGLNLYHNNPQIDKQWCRHLLREKVNFLQRRNKLYLIKYIF